MPRRYRSRSRSKSRERRRSRSRSRDNHKRRRHDSSGSRHEDDLKSDNRRKSQSPTKKDKSENGHEEKVETEKEVDEQMQHNDITSTNEDDVEAERQLAIKKRLDDEKRRMELHKAWEEDEKRREAHQKKRDEERRKFLEEKRKEDEEREKRRAEREREREKEQHRAREEERKREEQRSIKRSKDLRKASPVKDESNKPTLHDRFSSFDKVKPFRPDDNISINIERNIKGTEKARIPRNLAAEAVVLKRRGDEGEKIFSKRTEFEERGREDDGDKRSIRVRGERRGREEEPSINFKFSDRDKREQERYERKMRAFEQDAEQALGSRRDRDRSPRDRSPRRRGGGDLRADTERRGGGGGSIKSRLGGGMGSQPEDGSGEASRNKNLPDFKNRPGKYIYESWRDHPEMIPKGSSYFEHDNRESDFRRGRGRGRGGNRPWFDDDRSRSFNDRGRFGDRGGSFGDRTGRRSGVYGGQWVHDKFEDDAPAEEAAKTTV